MNTKRFSADTYTQDHIRAVDAKFEAQKIAFAPLAFQAVKAMIDFGILKAVSDAGDNGINAQSLADKTGISLYGVKVLAEMALGMQVLRLAKDSNSSADTDGAAIALDPKFTLGKTGWFLLEDDMTKVNFNFTNDICYKGAWDLESSIKNGKPEGLKVFGDKWTTIYEALSTIPESAKKSWFEFDHFYSSIAFPEALPIVFEKKPRMLFDIGGNTAKWAIACCTFDKDVNVKIVDLPGQTAVAEQNAKKAGFEKRISFCSGNVLDKTTVLPSSADAVWMSQFLDCFSLHQVTKILTKVHEAVTNKTDVWVLEPLWDKQNFEASSYSLQATSLYFTCMANGNSKMYRYAELKKAIEDAGFELICAHHKLGSNSYSLLNFHKKA
jgi:hypothetical protein